ncbi:MAG: STAS domain-containing protein, partial [Betaproteobacteria bacterium]|nr:STAS domain-containing protein [Betaproteobacteria bacterium]
LSLDWPQDLQLTNCVQALERFEPLVAKALVPGQPLHCSLATWQRVDTGALAVLLSLRRLARRAKAQLQFCDVPRDLLALARVSQVDRLLGLQ